MGNFSSQQKLITLTDFFILPPPSNMIQAFINRALQIVGYVPKNGAETYMLYTLDELNAMSLWQRAKLQNWNLELLTLITILIYVVLFKIGDMYNQSLVNSFLLGLKQPLESNFFQFGTSKDQLYIKDSAENYSSYATGRENISRVNIDFKLRPRHNIFVWILEGIMSYFTSIVQKPIDKVDIVIHPSASYDNFISAVVSKVGMDDYRKFNYFLSLTKTADSSKLPESFVFMSEGNEFQDKLLTPDLEKSLDVEAGSFIRYIAFTDQPTERPEKPDQFAPFRRVIVSLKLTSNKKQIKQAGDILNAIFSTIDELAEKSITFKQEALKKVVKTREVELSKVLKAAELERQEAEAEAKAELKKQERDRARNLSPEEQAKLEKKEMEKRQKKLQKKQRVRM